MSIFYQKDKSTIVCFHATVIIIFLLLITKLLVLKSALCIANHYFSMRV